MSDRKLVTGSGDIKAAVCRTKQVQSLPPADAADRKCADIC